MKNKAWLESVFSSARMCGLFLFVYGWINAFTATRTDVGMLRFAWENQIPFLSCFILPYMSLDTFFLLSPFFCQTREERRTLEKQVILGILISGACFLLWPLRVSFIRPTDLTGFNGWVFNHFLALDPPFNACPSLHIVLSAILLPVYIRRAKAGLKLALVFWFAMIAASTVFTYQHQFMDVVGGVVLAGLLFLIFPNSKTQVQLSHSHRIALNYSLCATFISAAALKIGGLGLVFLWPALSFAWIGVGYWGWGASVYGKAGGKLPLLRKLLLAPVLSGQWLSLRYYASEGPAFQNILPQVQMGRFLSQKEAKALVAEGVMNVLDLTCEFSEAPAFLDSKIRYKNIAILDLTAPEEVQLQEAIQFLRQALERGEKAYVHCKAGYSRTACIVGAWLLVSNQAGNADQAIKMMTNSRPHMIIRPEAELSIRNTAELITD